MENWKTGKLKKRKHEKRKMGATIQSKCLDKKNRLGDNKCAATIDQLHVVGTFHHWRVHIFREFLSYITCKSAFDLISKHISESDAPAKRWINQVLGVWRHYLVNCVGGKYTAHRFLPVVKRSALLEVGGEKGRCVKVRDYWTVDHALHSFNPRDAGVSSYSIPLARGGGISPALCLLSN